ncbi:uncharacterized protein LOC132749358 [Ruditapes philippinarum]|uniref:uncharacterized protein LOC132749358 n=1 Tax=Ruditapes philippinarum TaxID=129788 RepID=UPI00295C2100|nr:uncharacterized protein LOC132749358 [Ruditapes philippinarum]
MATSVTKAALGRRAATNEDLNYISQCIGSNWEILGPFLLKTSTVTIEHIRHNHTSCQQRVYNLLLMWRQETDDQSLAHLFHLMYKAGTSVTIDWNVIAENLKIKKRDIQACKEGYQYPVQERTQQHDLEYQSQVHAQETKQQQDSDLNRRSTSSFVDSKKSLKDSCIFDGRLILLDSNQVNDLEASLDKGPIGRGRLGFVYRSNNPDIFGIPVAVKKINTKGDSKIESQVRREKIACRLMNPFILPLLAVVEKSNETNEKREVWFVSPLCENGGLDEVLKHDRKKSILKLNAQKRVKILLQVALAIQYIHTAVPDVRAVILHKDIASKNIVLDGMFNARLIGFGLAREEDDILVSTVPGGRLYYSHPNIGKEGANESWDYYSFGVIVREMITDFGPEGNKTKFLKNMTAEDFEAEGVTNNIYEKVWNYEYIDNAAYGKLKDIATQLLTQTDWKAQDFTKNVLEELHVRECVCLNQHHITMLKAAVLHIAICMVTMKSSASKLYDIKFDKALFVQESIRAV